MLVIVCANSQPFSVATLSFTAEDTKSAPDVIFKAEIETYNNFGGVKNVSVAIPSGRAADVVDVKLDFGAVWMLLSEVDFESKPVHDHWKKPGKEDGRSSEYDVTEAMMDDVIAGEGDDERMFDTNEEGRLWYLEVVVGVLAAFSALLLLVLLAAVLVVYGRKRRRGRDKGSGVANGGNNSQRPGSLNPFPIQINMKVMRGELRSLLTFL